MTAVFTETNSMNTSEQAQQLLEAGEYEQAILVYQEIQPESASILYTIGILYTDRIGSYELAISCFERALQIQEQRDDLTSELLSSIARAYQNLREYDLAIIHHHRALQIRQSSSPIDRKLIATNLFGIANAYWGQENLSEALNYAQQALVLNQSIKSGNELNIATNSAILANIFHHFGDDIRALEFAQRALVLLETCVSSDSPTLAPLLNNIGTIQISMNMFNEALLTFIRVLHICQKTLPEDHPKRIQICNNIQRVTQMQQYQKWNISCSYLWDCLTKVLLS